MKKIISNLIVLALLLLMIQGSGCKKDGQSATQKKSSSEGDSLVTGVGRVVSIFELKYGENKEIAYDGLKLKFSIKSVIDDVSVNCSLVDFGNNHDGPKAVRIYSDLVFNDSDVPLQVGSKPCGALNYSDNKDNIQEIANLIETIKAAPAMLTDTTYYNDTFINYFGEGSKILNTSLRVYMAKAYPVKYDKPDARLEDYKFIYILTSKN